MQKLRCSNKRRSFPSQARCWKWKEASLPSKRSEARCGQNHQPRLIRRGGRFPGLLLAPRWPEDYAPPLRSESVIGVSQGDPFQKERLTTGANSFEAPFSTRRPCPPLPDRGFLSS
ncbi:hypothetical protein RRG08_015255 [Elysia crispata]|uniref:Uncharacterized protein n=1 Tax=Elysia crispata TaxID=231223 RepID=A0AAE1D7J3_9GAST|nr:hypothetical protein RRG08_015255 [Elysia crispata]